MKLVAFLVEGFDLADAMQVIVEHRVQFAQFPLAGSESRAHVFGKHLQRDGYQRDRDQAEQGQAPVQTEQHEADPHQGQHIDEYIRDGVGDHLLEQVGIIHHSRHQLPGLRVLVKPQGQPLQMIVQKFPHVGDHAPTGDVRLITAHVLKPTPHDIDQEHRNGHPDDEILGLTGGICIRHGADQYFDDPGDDQLGADQ